MRELGASAGVNEVIAPGVERTGANAREALSRSWATPSACLGGYGLAVPRQKQLSRTLLILLMSEELETSGKGTVGVTLFGDTRRGGRPQERRERPAVGDPVPVPPLAASRLPLRLQCPGLGFFIGRYKSD
ncbi:hypothetical protein ACQ4WX_37660 [Streptomyces lasalocidi]